MRIKFVNAYNGNEEFGGNFFEKLGKLALCDIRVAQATGEAKDIANVLKSNKDFKGKVTDSKGYTELNEKVSYVTFTMPVTKKQAKYSETTGEFVEMVDTTEDYVYYLEVRSNI